MIPIEFHPEAAQEANDSVDYYTGIHIDLERFDTSSLHFRLPQRGGRSSC